MQGYNLLLQSYNFLQILKIVKSCTGFLGVAGPSGGTILILIVILSRGLWSDSTQSYLLSINILMKLETKASSSFTTCT